MGLLKFYHLRKDSVVKVGGIPVKLMDDVRVVTGTDLNHPDILTYDVRFDEISQEHVLRKRSIYFT